MVKVKMANHHPQIFSATAAAPETPKFPFDNKTEDDLIDDEDDCIICGKLLLEHSEEDANQCYSTLTKKQLFKKQLSKRRRNT